MTESSVLEGEIAPDDNLSKTMIGKQIQSYTNEIHISTIDVFDSKFVC
jgi:hypothetical protein